MGIFNLFRKPEAEDVYDAIAADIVASALRYRKYIETDNKQYSSDAGAEMAYFLLHMLDRELDKQSFATAATEEIFDQVATEVLEGYIKASLKAETPLDVALQLGREMFDTVNERQRVYSTCEALIGRPGSGVPTRTIVFALAFYIHRALGKTNRDDIDKIVAGQKTLAMEDMDDFPDFGDMSIVETYAVIAATESVKMWRKALALLPQA